MNLKINRDLFTHVNIDSASLSLMTAAVHRFDQPGRYEGVVTQGPLSRRFMIVVEADSAAQAPQRPSQASVDLKDISDLYAIKAGGYVLFHASAGSGYAVEVYKTEKGAQKVFDSRELKDGDVLSATVIRPGTYSVTNVLNNARAELVVGYPELGKARRNMPALTVECTAREINPNRIRLEPAQGLVFACKAPSRIKIELTQPEDRPARVYKDRIQARRVKGEKRIIRKYRLMPSGSA
jgi:hypothetical protein